MAASRFALYWHTLRYLKLSQFYYRFRFHCKRPRLDLSDTPGIRCPDGVWIAPACRRPSMVGPRTFVFMHEMGSLPQIGWNGPHKERLWRYNQHYFDDLNSHLSAQRNSWHSALLSDWISQNPVGTGTGWEPYPTSLRIVNWLKWSLAGNYLSTDCMRSLALQARWLAGRLERHLLGNHLFANAKALVFAGLAFQNPEARRWLATGLRLLDHELSEQVLDDGGNFERSTMYHALFLEDVLDLLNVAHAWSGRIEAGTVGQWRQAGEQMLYWLQRMTHPDGEIAFFNDAAFGIAPSPAELASYAERLGLGKVPVGGFDSQSLQLTHLQHSGYIRMDSPTSVAFLDVAPVGPDYLPGHAHADTLSFELSLFGNRVVVNGGTSRYGLSNERIRERHTAAHSTVEIDGESSSEVWSGFRVARRAYPIDLAISVSPEIIVVGCSHNGYQRLPGKPIHRRQWRLRSGSMEIQDCVSGGFHRAVSRYIIHPGVAIRKVSGEEYQLKLPLGQVVRARILAGHGDIESAQYAPEFGKVISTQCLAVNLDDGAAHVHLDWN